MRLLLALRYRLIWAHARSRQGRMLLLAAGYCLLMLVIGLLALGGFGAAAASIRLGHGRLVAAIGLAALWMNGIVGAIVLGIGVSPAFSESSLRRYPLSRMSRLTVRHATALLEPFWLVMLAFTLSLAAGFAILGVSLPGLALLAGVLFLVNTYLMACVVTSVGEWLLTRRGGSLIGLGLALTVMLLIPIAPAFVKFAGLHPWIWSWMSTPMAFTPPVIAADAMTSPLPGTAAGANFLLVVWACALTALLALADRLPRYAAASRNVAVRWRHPVDRAAAIFGASEAPLAGKILRYYVRSPQVRLNYPVALPLIASMAFMNAGRSSDSTFVIVLGAAPVIAFLATGALSMNLFGYDGAGFSRHFLLPLSAGRILRTMALASLIPGALLIPVGLLLFWLLMPDPTLRMGVMLLAVACGGLLFFHALAIWTSIFAPRPIPFDLVFGNKLSAAANALMVGAIVVFFGLSLLFNRIGIHRVLDGWWMALLFFVAALSFFAGTLRAGAHLLTSRREQILAELEGL